MYCSYTCTYVRLYTMYSTCTCTCTVHVLCMYSTCINPHIHVRGTKHTYMYVHVQHVYHPGSTHALATSIRVCKVSTDLIKNNNAFMQPFKQSDLLLVTKIIYTNSMNSY